MKSFALKQGILGLGKELKTGIIFLTDFILFLISGYLALVIQNSSLFYPDLFGVLKVSWLPAMGIIILSSLGAYKSIVRFIDFSAIFKLLRGLIILTTFSSLIIFGGFGFEEFYGEVALNTWIMGWLFSVILIVGSRLMAHTYFSEAIAESRVIIYGAGSAGIQLATALKISQEMHPIAFIDKDKTLHNSYVGGLKILPPSALKKIVEKNKVDEVLIAMPSASKSVLRSLLKEIEDYAVKVRILPGLAELAQGKVLVSELKEVDISDLLGRLEVNANQELLNKNIKEKVVLITGAGGSIGSEISRQVAKNNPSKIILLDSNEFSLYEIKKDIELNFPETDAYSILGSVTNSAKMNNICKFFNVNTIYHTAAYKHVPLVEENPFEAILNNIIGTKVCAEAAVNNGVETFVLISTDKAVRPTNIMGASKRFAELILQSIDADKTTETLTKMIMVRFGNVIGSSGSAIPLFQQQIKNGGPITVTHPEVLRYFMSIPEAAELVIQAGAMGSGGDVFVLDMGEPVKVLDLAKRLIGLSGLELKDRDNPNGEIEITFTGLRPGEKLYEELLIGDNVSTTQHKKILRAEEDYLSKTNLENFLELIKAEEQKNNVVGLKEILKNAIPGFLPDEDSVDVMYLQQRKLKIDK
jgi:FlaA1/EpsC-like NDP-sugar epimerase